MMIAGTRVLITYKGQPPTYYGYNEQRSSIPRLPPPQALRNTTNKYVMKQKVITYVYES
jgi:hypothetical protein